MKKSFILLLRKALFIPPLFIILFSVAGWTLLEYFSWQHEFVEEISKIIEERKGFIKERTLIAASYIDFQRTSSLSRKKAFLESKIVDTYDFIDSFYDFSVDAEKQGLEKMIFKTLDEMAFDESGGFVMRDTGDVIFSPEKLHPPGPSSFEKIPSDYLLANIDENMEGRHLISYVFKKDEKNPDKFNRIFCLKRFRPFGWVIGVSASYEDVEQEAMSTITGWFSKFESIGHQGFIFIMDSDGNILSNSNQPQMVGKNIRETVTGAVTDSILKGIGEKTGEFTKIDWLSNGPIAVRRSEVQGFLIPEWGWTVGVGFFTDDLEKVLEYKKAQGKREVFVAARFFVVIFPLFLIIGILAYRRVAMRLEKNFLNFHSFFKSAQEKGSRIEIADMDFTEFESMADAANKMLEELHTTESKLRQSEANFASFFNAIEDCIFVVDDDLKILAINPAAANYLDISNMSVSHNDIRQFYDTETIDIISHIIFNSGEQTKGVGQGFLSRGDSFKKNVETFVFEGMWNSKKAFFILSGDISELVASEEKFSKIFSESPVMMAVSTIEEGRFVDINKVSVEYLEYPLEHFIGKISSETGVFADPTWRNRMMPVVIRDGRIRNEEVDLVTRSGNILHCLVSLDLISYSGSKYILTVANNITERKKAEQSLLAAKEEAILSRTRLEETLHELELFNRFMMDREERIISLKEEVNRLLKEAGKDPFYSMEDYINI